MKREKNILGGWDNLNSFGKIEEERIKKECKDMILKTGKCEAHEVCEGCNKNWIVDDVKVFYVVDSDNEIGHFCSKCLLDSIEINDYQKDFKDVVE